MYHGNDRLINLVLGAVVVIVFLLIGRLKQSLRKPPASKQKSRLGRGAVLIYLARVAGFEPATN